jgi:crotonobetainyl-CoA:carnitine CoA-transferase CaiB-like acyl-CoA transferase
LHAGHESVALDFEDPSDLRALHALVEAADVVVEGSRPRALRQLGIDAESVLRNRPGVTWVSITGYGRTGANADRVAFGDDAAVAGGLVAIDADGHPVFCGDAIADPLSGLYAAEAAAASVGAGGGRLVSVALADVAAVAARFGEPVPAHEVTATGADRWVVRAAGDEQEVLPPPPLQAVDAAPALGADTRSVLSALAGRR